MTPDPPYPVADYLLGRIVELGVDTIYGVPGDFTLGFLDHIDAHPDLPWVGTANELGAGTPELELGAGTPELELGAGYAADGYAQIKGLGVLCTTFGVGELSADAEHALVGSPTEAVQSAARPTHHPLEDSDFLHMLRMAAEITVNQAIPSAETTPAEIDRVLLDIITRSQAPLSVSARLPHITRVTAPQVADRGRLDLSKHRTFRYR